MVTLSANHAYKYDPFFTHSLQHSSISAKRTCRLLYKMQQFCVNFTFPFDLAHNFFIKIDKKNVFTRKRDDRLSLIQKDLNKSL